MTCRDNTLAVIVVCHDSAETLRSTLNALLAQLRADDELVVVDNASSDSSVEMARATAPEATFVELSTNVGFAAGCHAGASASKATLLLFLNPDAEPAPGCIEALRGAAAEHPSWGAWQALVTMRDDQTINSAGNVVHFLGIGWAGECGRMLRTVEHRPHEVGFVSGAAFVVRREAWDRVGGFDRRYFMYGEDLDLSLRLRLAGWKVGVVPTARVAHDYAFEKGAYKWFYLERNRAWTVLGAYPAPLLALVIPALVVLELALLGVAARGGWLRSKLRAHGAVTRELPSILRRRRQVQALRRISTAGFAAALSAELDSPYLDRVAAAPWLVRAQVIYWRAVHWLLRLRNDGVADVLEG